MNETKTMLKTEITAIIKKEQPRLNDLCNYVEKLEEVWQKFAALAAKDSSGDAASIAEDLWTKIGAVDIDIYNLDIYLDNLRMIQDKI